MSVIATIGELEAIYGQPNQASTVKVANRITPQYRVLIDKSPFAALATSGPEGLDCSPDKRIDPKTLPTPGQILADMSENRVGGEDYDRAWPERARQSLW